MVIRKQAYNSIFVVLTKRSHSDIYGISRKAVYVSHTEKRRWASQAKKTGFESQLHHLPAVGP